MNYADGIESVELPKAIKSCNNHADGMYFVFPGIVIRLFLALEQMISNL